MSNLDLAPNEGFVGLDYDSRAYLPSQSWPVPIDQAPPPAPPAPPTDAARDLSPLQTTAHGLEQQPFAHDPHLIVDWQFQHLPSHSHHHHHQHHHMHCHHPAHEDPSSSAPATLFPAGSYGIPVSSPVDLVADPAQNHMSTGLLDGSYLQLPAPVDMASFAYSEFQPDLMPLPHGLPDMSSYPARQNVLESSSPTDLEVRSLTSSSSDQGWNFIEHRNSLDYFPEQGMFINPTQTLHDRSLSDSSSYSPSLGSYVEVSYPVHSPTSETSLEGPFGSNQVSRRVSYDYTSPGSLSPTAVSPVAVTHPVPVPANRKGSSPTAASSLHSHTSSSSSSSSSASSSTRKQSRRSPIAAKSADTRVRKNSQNGKSDADKRVGKRKGPLKPDQRKQASEIRKLRACLRCKFLKKTVSKPDNDKSLNMKKVPISRWLVLTKTN